MDVNFERLKQIYFTFDEPVKYSLSSEKALNIYPVYLKDSALFLSCCDILTIKKDEINSVDIIQMSYLEFLATHVLKEQIAIDKIFCILKLCLKMQAPRIIVNEKNKYLLTDDKTHVMIKSKQFDDIRRIIMYQNIYGYDDSYINPDLRKSIEETRALQMNGIDVPDLERKMAIISAHNGMSKKEQMEMTLRSHESLFQEVRGEVEFITTRAVALYGGKGDKVDHWIYKKKKGKFDDYLKPIDSVKSQFGNGMISNN